MPRSEVLQHAELHLGVAGPPLPEFQPWVRPAFACDLGPVTELQAFHLFLLTKEDDMITMAFAMGMVVAVPITWAMSCCTCYMRQCIFWASEMKGGQTVVCPTLVFPWSKHS